MPRLYVLPDQKLVDVRNGEPVLDAALRAGVPWTHACGGFALCSTCRLVVVEGAAACGDRTAKEEAIATRVGFGDDFRLACQLTVSGDATVRRLVIDDADRRLADVRSPLARVWLPMWAKKLLIPFVGRLLRRRSRRRPIGVQRDIAVLFADIRGFTPFAEAVLPYDVIHVLERHLRDMTQIVERHGGQVTSYMGDGLMAVFSDDDGTVAVGSAVTSALAMVEHVQLGRRHTEEIYGRSFEVNVGLHFGSAIVGALWGDQHSVTAIGDDVNLASRIEQANKITGTSVLASTAIVMALGERAVIGRTIRCELPGKSGDFDLAEILDLKPVE